MYARVFGWRTKESQERTERLRRRARPASKYMFLICLRVSRLGARRAEEERDFLRVEERDEKFVERHSIWDADAG